MNTCPNNKIMNNKTHALINKMIFIIKYYIVPLSLNSQAKHTKNCPNISNSAPPHLVFSKDLHLKLYLCSVRVSLHTSPMYSRERTVEHNVAG